MQSLSFALDLALVLPGMYKLLGSNFCLLMFRSLRILQILMPSCGLQIHPVVSRLCAPIEGTDAGHIADCLGLDSAKVRLILSKFNAMIKFLFMRVPVDLCVISSSS